MHDHHHTTPLAQFPPPARLPPYIRFTASQQPIRRDRTLAFQFHLAAQLQLKRSERIQNLFGRIGHVDFQGYYYAGASIQSANASNMRFHFSFFVCRTQ